MIQDSCLTLGHTGCAAFSFLWALGIEPELLIKDFDKLVDQKILGTDAVDFREGAETDGLSVPRLFRWFLPVWDETKPEYSMVGATHDALYATAGFGGTFTREDSDDFLRGGLRCAHKDRKHAGIADMAVRLLACRHWGAAADTHDLRDYVTVTEETA